MNEKDDPARARKNAVLKRRALEDTSFGCKVARWCGYGYDYARAQLEREGVHVGLATVSKFYQWWEKRAEFLEAEKKTEIEESEIRKEFPKATEQEIAKAVQEYFESEVKKHGKPSEVRAFTRLWLAAATAARKAGQEAQKLKLEERKVAVLEKTRKKGRGRDEDLTPGLRPETLARIEAEARLL